MGIPKKYTARLNRKDKKKQLRSIRKAKRSYKKGKYNTVLSFAIHYNIL